jgi:hypothetical protein
MIANRLRGTKNLCERLTSDEIDLVYSIQAVARELWEIDDGKSGRMTGLTVALRRFTDELEGKL